MLMIDGFSKFAEVVPIRNKEAATTAVTFYREWVCRYGAPAQVVTDCGTEWDSYFTAMLRECGIDHRTTQPDHPSSNGQVERLVRTMKRALTRVLSQTPGRDRRLWDELLPQVVMAYNFSVQDSTRLSPYYILFGRPPVYPAEVSAMLQSSDFPETLLSGDDALVALRLIERAELIRQFTPMALGNLLTAQHRQMLFYARRRDGRWAKPAAEEFRPGQFVVTQLRQRRNLDPHTADLVMRVLYVRPDGTLVMQGLDGAII
jgi:hypothetical protein